MHSPKCSAQVFKMLWTLSEICTVLHCAFPCSIFCYGNNICMYCSEVLIYKMVTAAPATLDSIQGIATLGWTPLTVPKSSLSQGKSLFFPFKGTNEFSGQGPPWAQTCCC